MIVFKTVETLNIFIHKQKNLAQKIGFVPTMGALHAGHISLIKASKSKNLLTVCSIFVNPTQFNDPKDFANYPITIESDILLLEQAGCDVLFLPSKAEIYPKDYSPRKYELGYVETILEGKYRPGHFQGVCQVVDELLNIVQPNFLFLGQKDFQQCMVIQKLIQLLNIPVEVIICATERETNGLAMSSRNKRLSNEDVQKATQIFKSLLFIQEKIEHDSLETIINEAKIQLVDAGFEKVDYIEICEANTLKSISVYSKNTPTVILIAAFIGGVRLIDNLLIS